MGRRAAQGEEVSGGVVVEPEGSGQALEHLLRRVVVAALFKTCVVGGADPGQHGELLAAQARHPASVTARDADVLGLESFAAGPEELGQLVRSVHGPDSIQGNPRVRRHRGGLAKQHPLLKNAACAHAETLGIRSVLVVAITGRRGRLCRRRAHREVASIRIWRGEIARMTAARRMV